MYFLIASFAASINGKTSLRIRAFSVIGAKTSYEKRFSVRRVDYLGKHLGNRFIIEARWQ